MFGVTNDRLTSLERRMGEIENTLNSVRKDVGYPVDSLDYNTWRNGHREWHSTYEGKTDLLSQIASVRSDVANIVREIERLKGILGEAVDFLYVNVKVSDNEN